MRVLWIGDAACASGFARCTHAVCDELHRTGWDVHILGLNYYGDPHDYPYTIWPALQPLDKGSDTFGLGRLPRLAARLRPDVVVILNDPWNVAPYVEAVRKADIEPPLTVAWVAVDSRNHKGDELNCLDRLVVWTEFAAEELVRGGYEGEPAIVPLGVDTDLFQPREGARERIVPGGIEPEAWRDAFVVGVVGRNQPRKRLDLTLEYFAAWDQPDALLYLHVAPTGDLGIDLFSLIRYYDLRGRVLLSQPDIGHGYEDRVVADVFNTFDLYWSTTQGEGWGLPALEAMACGVPCVVPDFSGLGSWARPAAALVPVNGTAVTAPLNSRPYTLGAVPSREATLEALSAMYADEALRREHSRRGRELARGLTWRRTGERFRAVLDELSRRAA